MSSTQRSFLIHYSGGKPIMRKCPRCSSQNLWSDNSSWGCHACGYAEINGQPTSAFIKKSVRSKEIKAFDKLV
ncbi:MAG: hypothetical protein PHC64_09465, partial [Candidatus Gastranaerophilales bacterium]|nr:hypothetical protein [Candidatus Gastranaerophilales bacterium]